MSNFWNEKIQELQEIFESGLFNLSPTVARERATKELKEVYGDSFRKDVIPSNPFDRPGAEERVSMEVKKITWRLINQNSPITAGQVTERLQSTPHSCGVFLLIFSLLLIHSSHRYLYSLVYLIVFPDLEE